MLIEAIAILSAGLLIFLVSLPLIYRKVPMNQLYGIRIPAAFESEQRWYDINAYGGRQLGGWAWLVIAAGVAGFFLPERDSYIYMPASTAVLLLAIVVPLVRIGQWTRRLPPNASLPSPRFLAETPRRRESVRESDLFKKRTVIPAMVLGLLCIAYLIFISQSAQWLPLRVATHFGSSGRANGWMSREFYLYFIAILGLGLATLIGGLGLAMSLLQPCLKPSRAASSAARGRNLSYLPGDFCWLACILLCLTGGTHYLTIVSNRVHPA
ncbi:MAG TPA: SdpI family protein, partial [Verrucomicrobiae bacterium]|nr:SdpI family protein [Verrucomicrobiae bacterium]